MYKNNYRICLFNGNRALFHGFEVVDRIRLRFVTLLSEQSKYLALKEYEETDICPPCMIEEKTREVVAIIELRDGTIKEVSTSEIIFLDSQLKFMEEGV